MDFWRWVKTCDTIHFLENTMENTMDFTTCERPKILNTMTIFHITCLTKTVMKKWSIFHQKITVFWGMKIQLYIKTATILM